METKYYTPTIEEFHVGFEFEIHTMSTGGFSIMSFDKEGNSTVTKLSEPDIKVWDKTKVFNPVQTDKRNIFKNPDGTTWDLADDEFFYHRSLKDIAELIKNNQIRVKELDQEDLESLRWKYNGSGWYDLIKVPGSLGYFTHVKFKFWGKETMIKAYRGEPVNCPEEEQQHLFVGEIKNKSELKRIMKQLQIWE